MKVTSHLLLSMIKLFSPKENLAAKSPDTMTWHRGHRNMSVQHMTQWPQKQGTAYIYIYITHTKMKYNIKIQILL